MLTTRTGVQLSIYMKARCTSLDLIRDQLRDEMRNESDATRAVCAVESFGSIEQPVSAFALGLAADYPALERLDEKVIPQPQTWPST